MTLNSEKFWMGVLSLKRYWYMCLKGIPWLIRSWVGGTHVENRSNITTCVKDPFGKAVWKKSIVIVTTLGIVFWKKRITITIFLHDPYLSMQPVWQQAALLSNFSLLLLLAHLIQNKQQNVKRSSFFKK